jgi:transposase
MTTDALGCPNGSRRRRTIEEKRRIVEETLIPGASVPVIARKYEVNANLLFCWRRLYQQGLLEVRDAGVSMAMLPVTQVPARKRQVTRAKPASAVRARRGTRGLIEIRLPAGGVISIQGAVDATALAHIIALLARG